MIIELVRMINIIVDQKRSQSEWNEEEKEKEMWIRHKLLTLYWIHLFLVCVSASWTIFTFLLFDDFVFFFSFTSQVITYEVSKRRSCHSHQHWTATSIELVMMNSYEENESLRQTIEEEKEEEEESWPDVRSSRHANDLINIDYLFVEIFPMLKLFNLKGTRKNATNFIQIVSKKKKNLCTCDWNWRLMLWRR